MVGKVGKMCTDDVQQEFLSMRDLASGETWNPKELWDHLKTRYVHSQALERQMIQFQPIGSNRLRKMQVR